MAEFTGRRKPRRLVGRIIGAGVILLMTVVADGAVERVVVGDVTIGTLARWHHVRARQLEAGTGMVELAVRPLRRIVTGLAGCRE